jgi:hypothetical protein
MTAWRQYIRYLDDHKVQIPDNIINMVKDDWYFNARDHRCPKDAWVIETRLSNGYNPETRQKESAEYVIRLLGAYHDLHIEYRYKDVFSVDVQGTGGDLTSKRYDDWKIDEFTVADEGYIKHSIYFGSGKMWTIVFKQLELDITQIQ